MDLPVRAAVNGEAVSVPEKRKACKAEDSEARKSSRNNIVDDVKTKLIVSASIDGNGGAASLRDFEAILPTDDGGPKAALYPQGAPMPLKASPASANLVSAAKPKRKAIGSSGRSARSADSKTQTMLKFLYSDGKADASNGAERTERKESKSPAESSVSTPSTMVSPSRPTSSRASSEKPTPSPKGSPKSSGSKFKSSLKQASLAFPASTAPVKSSASKRVAGTPTKSKLELMYPVGPVLGKKPTKIMDDLAPEMYPHAKPLPKFKDAPADGKGVSDKWRALTMQESLNLAAVAEFCTQYAEYLNRHTEVKLTLGLLEEYISDGNKHFDALTTIYQCLYRSLEPEIAVSKDSVQHRVAQHLLRSDSPERRHAGALFANDEFASIPPPVHAKILHHLVNGVIEQPEFHSEVRLATDGLQDMRTDKWASSNRKKALQEEHEALEAKLKEKQDAIDAIDIEIEALRVAAAPGSDEDNSDDGCQPAGKLRRGRAMQRLVSRDNQERKAKELKAKRMQQVAMVRDQTAMLSKIASAEKTFEKACQDEQTWDSRYAALDRMIRVGRGNCLGQDRYGRVYWWLEIQEPRAATDAIGEKKTVVDAISENGHKRDVPEEPSSSGSENGNTKSSPVPELVGGIYGIVVEAITYSYHGTDEPLDDKGKGFAKTVDEEAHYTPPANETKRDMVVKVESQFWYLDSLATALKLYRACNEKGARERELRNHLKPCLERVGVRTSAGVAGARSAIPATQAFSAFNAWAAGRQAPLAPPTSINNEAKVGNAAETTDRHPLNALALSVQSFGDMWFNGKGKEIPPDASLDDIKATIAKWAVTWNEGHSSANGTAATGQTAPTVGRAEDKKPESTSAVQLEESPTLPTWIETVEIVAGVYGWCEEALGIFEKIEAERAEVEAANARKRKRAANRGAAAAPVTASKGARSASHRSLSPSVTSSVPSLSPPPAVAGRGSRANNELRALQSAAAAIIALPTEYKRRYSGDRGPSLEPENHDPGLRTRSGRRVHERETTAYSDTEFDDILGDDDESATARRNKEKEKRKSPISMRLRARAGRAAAESESGTESEIEEGKPKSRSAAPISTRLRTRASRVQVTMAAESESGTRSESEGGTNSGSENAEAVESSEDEEQEQEDEEEEERDEEEEAGEESNGSDDEK
ncbi:hypothetical protein HDU86_007236 [Geranomyces michiganensis]|nr:hypothetical protein HDU86_007236 [Geranomyces michiganensis]